MTYFDRLAARTRATGSYVCVGLDPDFKRHRVDEVAAYNRAIIEATLPYAACYKPNIAFYEQYGIEGLRQLEETLRAIPADVPVIGDIKRGDMANTAAAYARAAFEVWGFDAVTLSPFLGRDSVEPFLAYEGRGCYLLCRTSNPGASDFQLLPVDGGGALFEYIARMVPGWGAGVGLVVGATAPDELRRVRELAPDVPLLVPGVGAQGGDAATTIRLAGGVPGRVVVNASRSIMYAGEGLAAPAAAARAARALRDELAAAATPV
jgi:orotidine-5'-phosphate decarboxylase